MKKALSWLLTIVLSAGLLTGCGGGASGAAATPAAETAAPETTPAPTATPVADTRPEEVRVLTEEPADLDPLSIRRDGKSCLLEIYEPLFDTESVGGALIGVLADSSRGAFGGYDHTAGTAVYSVYLRAGIADQDGNALTAADAAYCYGRMAETKPEGWGAWDHAAAVGDDQLDLTFTRELTGPGELNAYLTGVYLYTQKAYADHAGFLDDACGTGPYALDHFTVGTELLAVENGSYWQSGESRSPRAAANVKSIRYLFVAGAAERVIALETDGADMADCLDYADTVDFRGEGVYTDTFRVCQGWYTINDILIPNVNWQSKLKDDNLRLGIFYAVDNAAAAECFGEGGGRACWAVGNPDYPDMPASWQTAENYETKVLDVDSVRSYLRQAAYVNESLTLLVRAGTSGEQLADCIQSQLRPLSITINVTAVDAETFAATLAAEKGWDLAIVPVEADTSVAEVWKKLWTDNTAGGTTLGSLKDSKLQQLLAAVSTADGCTEENLTAVMQYVTEKAYGMGIAQKCRALVVPAGMTDVYLTGRSELLPGACGYGY